jgi:hypothetical protein
LLVGSDTPENVRFSAMLVCVDADELKSCVIVSRREWVWCGVVRCGAGQWTISGLGAAW